MKLVKSVHITSEEKYKSYKVGSLYREMVRR